jgi:hypothetical protein
LPPPEPATSQPGEEFVLVGIVGQEDTPTAFLRDQVDSRIARVAKGKRVAGWTVTLVTDRRAELRAGRKKRQWLCLFVREQEAVPKGGLWLPDVSLVGWPATSCA